MQKQLTLRLLAAELSDAAIIKQYIAQSAGISAARITGFYVVKQSYDARSKQVFVNLTINAYIDEPFHNRPLQLFDFKEVQRAGKTVLIVGAGPAGLFAALKCLELGVKPVVLERGKDVRSRRRDLAVLNKEGIVNPESNYCFGEGGAGTYSDGKLYTRSTKRGDVNRILQLLHHFGADERILFESHPHIGTNKLPHIITAIRDHIIEHGGEVHFQQKLTGIIKDGNKVVAVVSNNATKQSADAYILATGHSARDIFQLFYENNIAIEQKPFALGVRAEHPQELIDSCQYHLDHPVRPSYLPPAAYSLVQQVNNHGVFSFCMCPGGIIAPAATSPGEVVVNGWSPSKRNNPFANSGIVVQVERKDVVPLLKNKDWKFSEPATGIKNLEEHPLLMMHFQRMVEEKSFAAGGGRLVAPAQRMVDFTNKKLSTGIPPNSYLPGLQSSLLHTVLPPFIYQTLQEGFKAFGSKMHTRNGRSYFTNEAVIVATESRTSSPVRIPRSESTLAHPQLDNLFPCGEGGGYAGGIVSAAMDGERVAVMAVQQIGH